MKRRIGLVGAILSAAAYVAAAVVAQIVASSVHGAADAVRAGHDVSSGVTGAMAHPTFVDGLSGLVVVDVITILVCAGHAVGVWGAGRGVDPRRLSPTLLVWLGVSASFVCLGRLVSIGSGWIHAPSTTNPGAWVAAGIPWYLWTLLAVLHPVASELLFRGVVQDGIAESKPGWALAGSALLFALAQPTFLLAVLALIVGMVLAKLRAAYGLATAIAGHLALAVTAVAVAMLQQGLRTIVAAQVGLALAIVCAAIGFVLVHRRGSKLA